MKGMKTTIHVTIRIISNDILCFALCKENRKTYLVEQSRINVCKTFYTLSTENMTFRRNFQVTMP